MLEDECPGMSRSASSTSIHSVGPSGPSDLSGPAPTPALAAPAKSPSLETSSEAVSKPRPAEEEQARASESSYGAERFFMHPRSVYIVISERRNISEKFHWGIIVARSQREGLLYHRVFDGSQWTLEIEEHKDITADKAVLLILKVGDVPEVTPQWIEAIQQCITTANVPRTTMGAVTCRTFALAATYELGNGGFTRLYPNWNKARGIEQEAYQFAWYASTLGRRLVVSSQWSDL
ncbi:hypothetical protein MferCBS31731_006804 [Microsporum ferrugineum]